MSCSDGTLRQEAMKRCDETRVKRANPGGDDDDDDNDDNDEVDTRRGRAGKRGCGV